MYIMLSTYSILFFTLSFGVEIQTRCCSSGSWLTVSYCVIGLIISVDQTLRPRGSIVLADHIYMFIAEFSDL